MIGYVFPVLFNLVLIVFGGLTMDVARCSIPLTIVRVVYGGVTSCGDKEFRQILQDAVGSVTTYTLPNKDAKSFNSLFGDPKKGDVKTLHVTYTVSDGVERTVSAKEGESITINPFLAIKDVTFGGVSSLEGGKSFTDILQKAVAGNTMYTLPNKTFGSFRALFGDPKKGVVKTLSITYSIYYDGKDKTVSVKEGDSITLSAANVKKN